MAPLADAAKWVGQYLTELEGKRRESMLKAYDKVIPTMDKKGRMLPLGSRMKDVDPELAERVMQKHTDEWRERGFKSQEESIAYAERVIEGKSGVMVLLGIAWQRDEGGIGIFRAPIIVRRS